MKSSVFSYTITERFKLFRTELIKNESPEAICKYRLSLCPLRKIKLISTQDGSGRLFNLNSFCFGKCEGELQLERNGVLPFCLIPVEHLPFTYYGRKTGIQNREHS